MVNRLTLLKNNYNLICVISYFAILSSFYFFNLNPYDKVILYIVNFILCFIIYSLLFFKNRKATGASIYEIILIALLLRATLLFVIPVTSDDYYRYLWDGKVQSEGINPFKFSPLELSNLHDDIIYPKLTFPEINTNYPPLAQAVFFVSYKIFGADVKGLKLIFLIFDFGILIFLFLSLLLLKINSNYIFLYAFAPLIIFEFFINAHLDIIILFFLIGSFYFAIKNNIYLSALFLGASVLSKTYSIIFLPFFLIYYYNANKDLKKVLVSMVYFALPFVIVVFYSDGIENIFFSMGNYLRHWYSNNLPYIIILSITEFAGLNDHLITRIILVFLFAVCYLTILRLKINFIHKIYLTAFFYLFLSHTVHPWYLSLLVVLLPFYFNYAVFYWTCIICMTNITVYYYIRDKVWNDMLPVLILEYVVLVILFLYDFKKFRLKSNII